MTIRHLRSVKGCEAPYERLRGFPAPEVLERLKMGAEEIWEAHPKTFLYAFRCMTTALHTAPTAPRDGPPDRAIAAEDKIRFNLVEQLLQEHVLPKFRIEPSRENAWTLIVYLMDKAANV